MFYFLVCYVVLVLLVCLYVVFLFVLRTWWFSIGLLICRFSFSCLCSSLFMCWFFVGFLICRFSLSVYVLVFFGLLYGFFLLGWFCGGLTLIYLYVVCFLCLCGGFPLVAHIWFFLESVYVVVLY